MSKDVFRDDTLKNRGSNINCCEKRRSDNAVTGKHTTTCSGFCQANTQCEEEAKRMINFKLFKLNIFVEKYTKWQSFTYEYKAYKPGLDVSWETVVDVGFWRVHINK